MPDSMFESGLGQILKNVKVITTKGGDNLKMMGVTNITVGDKKYEKIGNKAESYKF